jgi:hypothetical protein
VGQAPYLQICASQASLDAQSGCCKTQLVRTDHT